MGTRPLLVSSVSYNFSGSFLPPVPGFSGSQGIFEVVEGVKTNFFFLF